MGGIGILLSFVLICDSFCDYSCDRLIGVELLKVGFLGKNAWN